ncbi:MAG: hypothetical protein WA851_19265 [Xanthobacteraceae bacterium]
MSDIWDTKDGRRRVRHDPPTMEEAAVAAQGLTDDPNEQMQIVASLMEVPVEAARAAVLRLGARREVEHVTVTSRIGAPRAVVVERRTPRFAVSSRRLAAR